MLPVQYFDELGGTIAGTRTMEDSHSVHGLQDVKLDSFAVEHDLALPRHVKRYRVAPVPNGKRAIDQVHVI
jgi:hypothetical protein